MSQAIDPAARVCGNCTGFEACQGVQLTDTPELLHCKEFSFKVAGAAPAGAIQTPQPASSPAAPMAPPVPEALAPAAPVAPQAPQVPAAPVAPPAPIAPPVAPQAPAAAAPQATAPATPPQAPTAPPAQAAPPIAPPTPPTAAPVGGVTYPQTPPAPSAPAAPVAPPAPQQAPAAPVAPSAPAAPQVPATPPVATPAAPTVEVAPQMPATPPTAAPQAPGAAPVSAGVSVFDDVNQFLAMDPNATDAAGRKALVKMANNLIKNYKAAKKASNDAVSQANIGVALAYLEARKADVSNMDVAPEAPPAAPAAPVAPPASAPQVPDAAPQAPAPEVAPTAEPAAPVTECGSEPKSFEQYALPAVPRDVRETLDVTIALMCDKVITHLTSSSEPPCMMTVNSIKTLCEARRAYNGSVEPTLMSLLQKIVEDKSALCDG